jgi:long-chain acyl-CoA synthetase
MGLFAYLVRRLSPVEWRDSTGNDSEYNHAWLNHYEPQVPHTLTIPDLTLPQLLEHTARAYPANVATIFFGEKLTYAQLNDHIDRLAAGLRSLGVKPNERVGVVLPNCPQFIIGLYAALKAGAIAVPLNPNSTARELHNHFIDAGVSTIIAADTPLDRIQKAMVNSPAKQLIVTGSQEYFPPLMKLSVGRQNRQVGVASSIQGDNTYSFANLIRDNEPAQPHPEITQEDAALLVYTGGTTASPRGVKLSHRNLVANALQMNAWIWDAREERKEVVLGVVPLFHGYGVTVVMNLAISVGAAILLLPRFNMRERHYAPSPGSVRPSSRQRPRFSTQSLITRSCSAMTCAQSGYRFQAVGRCPSW